MLTTVLVCLQPEEYHPLRDFCAVTSSTHKILEPVIWAWPDGPARFHASPRRAGLAVLVEKEGSGPVGPAL